ncbi:protein TsetseEP-like [Teleopsis dalmanni]|uniref:protein TsetseEP-like n=1 Tax=Teleopsis dalmanni TaxID=139649 RepID=UPI0018CEDCF9|nr:protein TsetseEP-like [Teleopsis dalmanni]
MKLFVGVLSIFLTIAGCINVVPSTPQLIAPRTDQTLASYLLQNHAIVTATDPNLSKQCFNIYLPLLQDAAEEWSSDYNSCLTTASQQRDYYIEQMEDQRNEITTTATGICSDINACIATNQTLDFFNCFSALSPEVIGTVYTISNNASDDAATLMQEFNLLEANMYRCTNVSERTYVQQTTNVYDALDYCLQNGLPSTLSTEATEGTSITSPSDDDVSVSTVSGGTTVS